MKNIVEHFKGEPAGKDIIEFAHQEISKKFLALTSKLFINHSQSRGPLHCSAQVLYCNST